jgi:hypothetical protein
MLLFKLLVFAEQQQKHQRNLQLYASAAFSFFYNLAVV